MFNFRIVLALALVGLFQLIMNAGDAFAAGNESGTKFSAGLTFEIDSSSIQPGHPAENGVRGHVAVTIPLKATDKCSAAKELEAMIGKPYPEEFEAHTCYGKVPHEPIPQSCKVNLVNQKVIGGEILEGGGPGYRVLCKVGKSKSDKLPLCCEALTS